MVFSVQILAALLYALVGAVIPLMKELVRDLRKKGKAQEFFASSFGKAVLKALDLDKPKDTPEALFKDLSEASSKMDGIVARIQEYTKADMGKFMAADSLNPGLDCTLSPSRSIGAKRPSWGSRSRPLMWSARRTRPAWLSMAH